MAATGGSKEPRTIEGRGRDHSQFVAESGRSSGDAAGEGAAGEGARRNLPRGLVGRA